MKKINFPDENGYGIPFLILIILILPYSHYFFPLLIPKLYSFEKYPILIIILSSILLISIILSVLHLIKCFKVKNFISIGTFSLSIILLLTVLTSSYVNYDLPKELYDKTQLKEIFIKQHLGNQKLIKSFYGKLSDGVEVMWFFTLETRFTNQGQGCISIMGKGSSEILKVHCGNLEEKINQWNRLSDSPKITYPNL